MTNDNEEPSAASAGSVSVEESKMAFDRKIPDGWWMGCSWATKDDYERIKATYEKQRLGEYLFKVENNLRRVEVTNDRRAADGLWTLANMMVRYDLTPRQVAGMATKMRRAIEVYDESCI